MAANDEIIQIMVAMGVLPTVLRPWGWVYRLMVAVKDLLRHPWDYCAISVAMMKSRQTSALDRRRRQRMISRLNLPHPLFYRT